MAYRVTPAQLVSAAITMEGAAVFAGLDAGIERRFGAAVLAGAQALRSAIEGLDRCDDGDDVLALAQAMRSAADAVDARGLRCLRVADGGHAARLWLAPRAQAVVS